MAVLVVVKVSKTYAAYSNLVESGVLGLWRSAARRWDRTVDLPEPDSPLQKVSVVYFITSMPFYSQEDHGLVLGT